jgi:glycosyltransferase involved in cell wall biosynthesis
MVRATPVLSVVIPMYNEEAVLPLLIARLRPILEGLGEEYEVVAVDDGSIDATFPILVGTGRTWPELRVIRLRRNAGHQAALTAGLHRARGQYVVSIDADLQDPPEIIPEMLQTARAEGLDIVYGVRSDRSTDTAFKRWTATAYYALMRRLVGEKIPNQAGDFRLLSRDVVEALRELPESRPVYRLLVPWIGFPSGEVHYTRAERAAGKTKYPLSKMFRLAFDSVATFSAAPLRLATLLGVTGFLLCAVLVVGALGIWVSGASVPGWASLFVAILFLGAVQLLCLGLLGEYIGRIYAALQARPSYYVSHDSHEADPAREIAVASEGFSAEPPPYGEVVSPA